LPVHFDRESTEQKMHHTTSFFLNLDRLGYGTEAGEPTIQPSGERALMRAVLHDAIDMLIRHRHAVRLTHRRVFRENFTWCWSNDDRYVFSFVNICEALGLNPSYLREGLQKALDAPPTEMKQRYKLRMHHVSYTAYHVGDVDTLGTRTKKVA